MFRPVREAGVNLIAYIDDRLSASASRDQAKLGALILFEMMAACGWYVSLKKSKLSPVHNVIIMGLIVDFALAQFRVPEKRLGPIRKQLMAALDNPGPLTPMNIASITCKIGSTRMAVPVAPLLCWGLYKAVKTTFAASRRVRTPEELRDILVFPCHNYEAWNGSNF